MKIRIVTILFLIVFLSCSKNTTTPISSPETIVLNKRLDSIFALSNLSGISFVVVNDEGALFQKSLGYADLASKKKYTDNTIQMIASVSKTLIAVAVMKALDEGKVELDEDINTYLPFEVKHPLYPDTPITLRHLSSHTSGILDDEVYDFSYVLKNPNADFSYLPEGVREYVESLRENVDIDESVFLENALSVDGAIYDTDTFSEEKPGEVYDYSNIASTLAAFVVESAVGVPYEAYTKQMIFDPLNMTAFGWNTTEINTADLATLYLSKEIPAPEYSLVTKADGGFLTSTTDFSKFMTEMLKGSTNRGVILSKDSFNTMFARIGISGQGVGIFWDINAEGNPSHNGGDPGVMTNLEIYPQRNIAIYMQTNTSSDIGEDIRPYINAMWAELLRQEWK
ncbi:MAG: serine hydrolase domain-containing protein [Maribacter sp.]